MTAELHIIMGTHDEHDEHDWIVGYVERAEDVERAIAKLYAEQKANRTILGPYRREERIFWKRYHDAQEQVSRELAIDRFNFDLIHKLTKAHQSAWCRRHEALFAKAKEVALASLDRRPMYHLEPVRYYATIAKGLDTSQGATQDRPPC